jgi:hypothetical protein
MKKYSDGLTATKLGTNVGTEQKTPQALKWDYTT